MHVAAHFSRCSKRTTAPCESEPLSAVRCRVCRAPAGLAAPVKGGERWSLQDAWQLACNMRRHARERGAHDAVTTPCGMLDRNKEAHAHLDRGAIRCTKCQATGGPSGASASHGALSVGAAISWGHRSTVGCCWHAAAGLQSEQIGVARTARFSTLNRNALKISCIEQAGIPAVSHSRTRLAGCVCAAGAAVEAVERMLLPESAGQACAV